MFGRRRAGGYWSSEALSRRRERLIHHKRPLAPATPTKPRMPSPKKALLQVFRPIPKKGAVVGVGVGRGVHVALGVRVGRGVLLAVDVRVSVAVAVPVAVEVAVRVGVGVCVAAAVGVVDGVGLNGTDVAVAGERVAVGGIGVAVGAGVGAAGCSGSTIRLTASRKH